MLARAAGAVSRRVQRSPSRTLPAGCGVLRPPSATQACNGEPAGGGASSAGSGDVVYATCKKPAVFAAAFDSESASIEGVKVTGNLGADGYGKMRAVNATGPRCAHARQAPLGAHTPVCVIGMGASVHQDWWYGSAPRFRRSKVS